MDLIKTLLPCFTGIEQTDLHSTNEKHPSTDNPPTEKETASRIISILFTTEKRGQDLRNLVQNEVQTCGWYEGLAKRILDALVAALKAGKAMGGPMKEAFDKASEEAERFVKEHPVLTAVLVTVVALGILAILTPWAISALGFGELGPVEGSFAAWWQSTYPLVPYGSLFSFLQKLGMTLGT